VNAENVLYLTLQKGEKITSEDKMLTKRDMTLKKYMDQQLKSEMQDKVKRETIVEFVSCCYLENNNARMIHFNIIMKGFIHKKFHPQDYELLAHLAKGNVSFCHNLAYVVC
jgi:hypothetical protein